MRRERSKNALFFHICFNRLSYAVSERQLFDLSVMSDLAFRLLFKALLGKDFL